MSNPTPPYAVTVGIDWADLKHDVFERHPDGSLHRQQISSSPEAITNWLFALRSVSAEGRVAVAVEQRRGPLFHCLSQCLDWMDLYPINPQTLARYRQAFYTSRAKDDPIDSQLLEDLLRSHPDRLRMYQPAPELERKLELFCQQRRKIVGLAVKLENQLCSTLKEYYSVAIDLCAPAALRTSLALDFLQRWPTFSSLKKARPETLRSFYYAHNSRSESLIKARLEKFGAALPITEDSAVVEPLAFVTKMLVIELRTITRAIGELDERIAQLFRQHPDHYLFESLPGAGDQLAPRLLCAFGADRSRWSEACQIQKTSGIAPVLERSGKSCWVHRRLFRPKFLCQTFHEFAGESIHRSEWAKTFYQSQRQKGKSHHSAIRILAFKWIRVIFRCWKSHTPYNETFYLDVLKKRHKNS
jgi:transposase